MNWILLGVSLLNMLLGLYVFRKDPTKSANRAFAYFTVPVVLWTMGLFFAHTYMWTQIKLFRLTFVGGSLLPVALLLLSKALPHSSTFRWGWDLRFFGLVGSLFTGLSFSPLIVVDRSLRLSAEGTYIQFIYGPVYPYFALYVATCGGYVFFRLIWQYRRASGLSKGQLGCLILGLVVPGSLTLLTNLFVPLLSGNSQLSKYGPLFSLLMIAMIGHAIIRHRLMDIRVVIKKGAVYVTAF
ncbi:MAG: histidine kinase N-terminal 7TM domain-containing protein, partial [Dehalococcoidia bacterium]